MSETTTTRHRRTKAEIAEAEYEKAKRRLETKTGLLNKAKAEIARLTPEVDLATAQLELAKTRAKLEGVEVDVVPEAPANDVKDLYEVDGFEDEEVESDESEEVSETTDEDGFATDH